jgi:PAS domain S-box-containing protein
VTLFAGPAGRLKRQRASEAAGFAVVIIAAVALLGWWASLPLLSSWGSGLATVRPLMASCLAALGLALMHPGKEQRLAFAVGLVVAAFTALGLGAALFNVELGIDRWLAPGEPSFRTTATSFRVTNAATLALGLAGVALAISRFERHRLPAILCGYFAGAIAVFVLLGYLTGIDMLYGAASVTPPALPTAVGLLCIVAGIILRIGAMPTLRKPRPSWHLLVALGCAIVAPLLLFGVYTGFSIGDAQFDEVRNELKRETRTLSAEVDREINGEIGRLQALAASPSLRQGDFAAFQRQAEASLAVDRGDIVLIDRNMHPLVNTWVTFGAPMEEAALQEPAHKALATGKPQVTGLLMGPVKQFVFGIIVPVPVDGESRYALVREPDQDTLERLVAANELPAGRHAVIADTAHHIVADSSHRHALIGQELPRSQWHRAEGGGVFEFVDSEGRSSLEAYAQSGLTGWEIAVWEPKALLEAPVRALWWTIGLTALFALALVLALASWLGRIIARSVGLAARAAIAVAEGGPLPPSGTPLAEVNALMAELRETAAKRQAAEGLLRDSARQLRLVTDNAPVGITHCDADLRYKFINRYHAERLVERFGVTREQVIGKRVPEVIGDKAFAIAEPHIRECLAGKAVEFEVEVPDPAGEPRCLHCHLEPEWKESNVVGLVMAAIDITGLKRAEAALRESEQTFRAMFDSSSVGKIEVEPASGRFLRVNAAMCKFVGYSEAELLGRSVYDITHPDDITLDQKLCHRLDAGESDFDVEKRYVRKDGKAVWARTTVNVIRDESGRPLRHMAVIQDINARKRAEEDVRAGKDRLQLALDAAQLGSWQYDPLRRVVSGDARCQEIFDFAEHEASIEEVIKRVHPDDAESVRMALAASLDPADPKRSATEFRVRRRDGALRWVETLGLAYFEGAQHERRAVSMAGTAQDITERKEREEKEHLLMHEINHRAKNMLSVVDAIAHQTAIKSPEDFIERFSERIQALSANQDLLVRNEWNGVEINDLVHAQLAHFADLIGPRIAVNGPKLRLRAASAQAIGLALHELATNAGKYGALSTDGGHVDISWAAADGTLTMSWTERGGPPVCAPQRRGFGTIVMETMTERSVDGAVDLDYAPAGLTWRLNCPAANALEPWALEPNSGDGKPISSRSPQSVSAPTKIFAKT